MVDEENEFNKICNSLKEIESLFDRMHAPSNTMEDGIHKREILAERGNYKKFVDFEINFTQNYYNFIDQRKLGYRGREYLT